MSVHIAAKKVGGFLWKVAPYVLAVGGAVSAAVGYLRIGGEPEGPFHDRGRELQTELRCPVQPVILLKDGEKRLQEYRKMKEEYDEIMKNPKVKADLNEKDRRNEEGSPFILGGLASLLVGLWWLKSRASNKEEL